MLDHLKGGSWDILADHNIVLGAHGDYEQVETHSQVPDVSTGPVLADCDCEGLLSSVVGSALKGTSGSSSTIDSPSR